MAGHLRTLYCIQSLKKPQVLRRLCIVSELFCEDTHFTLKSRVLIPLFWTPVCGKSTTLWFNINPSVIHILNSWAVISKVLHIYLSHCNCHKYYVRCLKNDIVTCLNYHHLELIHVALYIKSVSKPGWE
jgi:hypothetical protein